MNAERKIVFLQEINAETTTESLNEYFENYDGTICFVPTFAPGQNRGYAKVTFAREEDVDLFMKKRPHIIDGKQVWPHRKVNCAQGLKDSYKIHYLSLPSVPNGFSEKEFKDYFKKYGTILDIWPEENQPNSWVIEFDDYDSVDRAILDQSHLIGKREILVTKGRLFYPGRRRPSATTNKNDFTKKEDSPDRAVRLHLTNLPSNITAAELSVKLDWPIFDILIKPSSPAECSLINVRDDSTIEQFIRRWDKQTIGQSTIQCRKEFFPLELCQHFQTGRCQNSDQECYWLHISCPHNNFCSAQCPFGHPKGTKKIFLLKAQDHESYRVKISGLPSEMTEYSIAKLFRINPRFYQSDPKNRSVAYFKMKTIKMARLFMIENNKKRIGGRETECQMEIESSPPKQWSHPAVHSDVDADSDSDSDDDKTLKGQQSFGKKPQSVPRSAQDSTDTPSSRNDDGLLSSRFKDDETQREKRLWGDPLRKAPTPTVNTQGQTLPPELFSQWTIDSAATNNNTESFSFLIGCVNRRSQAIIKRYLNDNTNRFTREFLALTALKGVTGVPQILQTSNRTGNVFWMVMNRVSGFTLRHEVNRFGRDQITVRRSIELSQHIIQILRSIHDKQLFHQNLSPDHIIIDWNPNLTPSIRQAPITLISFSRAEMNKDEVNDTTQIHQSNWYKTPQRNDRRCRSTVDASNVCAILLWLLTGVEPEENALQPFHDQKNVREKLQSAAKTVVTNSNDNEKTSRLEKYLLDTFDRAFGYPNYRPWTLLELQVRLEVIYELVSPLVSRDKSISSLFDNLLATERTSRNCFTPETTEDRKMFLGKSAELICQWKKAMIDVSPNTFSWSDGRCSWTDATNGSMNEFRDDDILIYSKISRGKLTNFSLIFICVATFSDDDRLVTLSIGTNINGKSIRVPLLRQNTTENLSADFLTTFQSELHTLLTMVCKEQTQA